MNFKTRPKCPTVSNYICSPSSLVPSEPVSLTSLHTFTVFPPIFTVARQHPARSEVVKVEAGYAGWRGAGDGSLQLQQGDVVAAEGAVAARTPVAVAVSDGSLYKAPLSFRNARA